MSEFLKNPPATVVPEVRPDGDSDYERLRINLEREMWRSVKNSPTGGIEGLNLGAGVNIVNRLQTMEADGGGEAAGKYAKDVLNLMKDDGLALSQAKLAMDLREEEQDGKHSLTDLERRQLIKDKGAFTMTEYRLLSAGLRSKAPSPEPKTDKSDKSSTPGDPVKKTKAGKPTPGGRTKSDDQPKPVDPAEQARRAQERALRERQRQIDAYRGGGSREEIDKLAELAWAERDYIELAARRERTVVGGFQTKSRGPKYLQESYEDENHNKKTRDVLDRNGKKVLNHSTEGRATDKNVEEARMKFESLRLKQKRKSKAAMTEAGFSDAVFLRHSKLDDETEAGYIANMIDATRQDYARPKGEGRRAELTQKFYDWWVRQGGSGKFFSKQNLIGNWKGNLAKGSVVAIPGFILGGAIAIAAPISAGAGLGAAAGFAIAKGYTRGLASGRISKNAEDATMAGKQAERRLADAKQAIHQSHEAGNYGNITNVYSEATRKEVNRNRARLAIATGIGAVSGTLGNLAGHAIDGMFNGGGHTAPVHHGGPNGSNGDMDHRVGGWHYHTPNNPSTPKHPPVHGLTGQEINVKPGDGEISVIENYAKSHNYHISGKQAFDIYQQLYQQHGSHIIDLNGSGPSTYVISPGNIGLSHPGLAHWHPGVEHQLRQMLEEASENSATN